MECSAAEKTTEWVSVGDLGKAFEPDSNILQNVTDLAGKSVVLYGGDGSALRYSFIDDSSLTWEVVGGARGGASGRESYSATRPRGGIYFVDFISSENRGVSTSLVLDLVRGIFTRVAGEMPAGDAAAEPLLKKIELGKPLTSVSAEIVTGTIDRPCTPGAALHEETRDLVGKRVRYVYSPTETYEHIYLNPRFYTWHCVRGIEAGLCDTDRCHYYKIDDNLYLFVWREKIVPTLGVIMVDFDRLKTTGKIFGYSEFDCGSLANFPVGAYASVINSVTEEAA